MNEDSQHWQTLFSNIQVITPLSALNLSSLHPIPLAYNASQAKTSGRIIGAYNKWATFPN